MKYIDVTRTTHTKLYVLQESRIDDHWNVDVDRNLVESWTVLSEKLPKGKMCPGSGVQQFKQLPDLPVA